MISQLNNLVGGIALQSTNNDVKANAKKTEQMNKEADISKVDKLKSSIASCEYKVDLGALSKRIADELM